MHKATGQPLDVDRVVAKPDIPILRLHCVWNPAWFTGCCCTKRKRWRKLRLGLDLCGRRHYFAPDDVGDATTLTELLGQIDERVSRILVGSAL